MTRKEQIEDLLGKQVQACVATITGNSNPAKGYRKKVKGAKLVEIPSSLGVQPAPVEIVKEVPGPEVIVEKTVEIETTEPLYIKAGLVILSLAVGATIGVAFFC